MATLDVIGSFVQDAPALFAREVIQGEQFSYAGRVHEQADLSDDPIDLAAAGYTLTAVAEFYLTSATVSNGTLNVAGFTPAGVPDRTLTTSVSGTAFHVTVPADIYPAAIDPAITANVPVAVVYLTFTRGGTIDIERFLLVFRRGPESSP